MQSIKSKSPPKEHEFRLILDGICRQFNRAYKDIELRKAFNASFLRKTDMPEDFYRFKIR